MLLQKLQAKMDLKTTYSSVSLEPFYAGSGAIASVTEDGSLLVTCVVDRINVISLKEPQRIVDTIDNDDEQEITALSITPDGSFVCFVSQSQLLRVYSLEKKKVIRSMKVSSPVYIMGCDDTSTLLAIGGTDGSVNVIDIANGYITHSLKGHGATISCIKFYGQLNSDVWRLGSGDTNGMVKIWDLVKRKCVHTIQEHTNAVRGLDFRVKDEEKQILELMSGGRDDVVNFVEFDSRKKCKLVKTIPISQQVESCGYIKNSDVFFTAGGSAEYQLWSYSTGKILSKTEAPVEELFIIGVLPFLGGTKHFLVLSDHTLFLVDIQNALDFTSEIIPVEAKLAGNHGTIADIKFVGPESNSLALATNSPTLRIIAVPGNSEETIDKSLPIRVDMYEGHTDLLNCLDATEDGTWLATASKDHTIILWRYHNNHGRFFPYAKFVGHVGSVNAVALPNITPRSYPDFIISGSSDLTIKKWKVPKPSFDEPQDLTIIKTSEYTRRAHEKDINSISISPNDSVFATASYDKTCKIWNVEDGEFQATLSSHKRGLWDVSFCDYDKLLATCSGDKTIKIWSLDTYTVLKTLEGHSNAVQRCSFINKNKQLISTGADGLIKIWDISSGDCVKTLDAHNNRIWALTTANDGESFITADADGFFQFWKDSSEEVRQHDLEEEKKRIEQEQSLQNYMAEGDWTNAFLLAMTLDHPMRLYNVIRQAINNDVDDPTIIINGEIDAVISTLDRDQIFLLMKRCRDWNTNARTHAVAQRMITCILSRQNIDQLSEIPGLIRIVDSIVSYAERHYARIDNLTEQSFILDHALVQMDKLL